MLHLDRLRPKSYRILIILAVLAALCATSAAQSATGAPPFSTFSGGAIDSINLANLNAHISVPIFGKAGRGMAFTYTLSFDNSIWSPIRDFNGVPHWEPASNFGWRGITEAFSGYISYTAHQTTCVVPAGQPTTFYTGFTYHDSNGTSHFAGNAVDSAGCLVVGFHDREKTNDGSGYIVDVTLSGSTLLANVYTPSGATITPPQQAQNDPSILSWTAPVGSGTVTDSNGNELSASASGAVVTFTDTLGTIVLTVDSSNPNSVKYTYTGPDGNPASILLNYTQYTVATNFGATDSSGHLINEYPATIIPLLSSIVFPDSSSYLFTYETTPGQLNAVTGRLASLQLPNGGLIQYTYLGGSNGITPEGDTAGLIRILGPSQWKYVRTIPASGPTTTTVTDPDNNDSVFTFSGLHELQRQIFQGSSQVGTLLGAELTCFNGALSNCATVQSVSTPITQVDVYSELASGLESLTETQFDSFGNPTQTSEFDYGNNTPGPLLRKVVTTYAELGNNISGKPHDITVFDESGNIASQATFGYDEGSVTAISAPQHVGITGSRGNITSIKQLVGPDSYLTKSFTYYDTGALNTYTDVNGAVVTYNYGAGSCNNSLPTGASLPLSLSISTSWDCIGGVITSDTDENQKTTTYNFNSIADPSIWRVKQETDPLNNIRSTTYGISTNESVLNFNGGSSTVDVLSTLDSYGRPNTVQIRRAPGSTSFDSIETDYDNLGRPNRTTSIYVGAAGQTNSSINAASTIYDALDRVKSRTEATGKIVSYDYSGRDVLTTESPAPIGENSKKKQFEYDGLGRLKSVCEITSLPGSGACGQEVAATGFLTVYTYDALDNILTVTQNAQSSSPQTRSFTYDLVSRRTSVTTPESGTITYIYDSDPSGVCSTSNPGDLVRRIDATGVSTCYIYDARRRMTREMSSGIGVVSIGGYEQNLVISSPSPGTGSLTLTGAEGAKTIPGEKYCADFAGNPPRCVDWEFTPPTTVYDSGTVTITVNGHNDSTPYGQESDASSVASGLASAINTDANAFVNASASGGVLTLQARQAGAGSNYNWNVSSASHDPTDFGSAGSFGASPTSGTLAGGSATGSSTTVYDTGQVSITVSGWTATVNYGQADTSVSVAGNLVSAINNSSGFPAIASLEPPARVELVPKQSGTYTLSTASATTNSNFSAASFTPDSAATNGIDLSQQTVFIYDAATVAGRVMANAKGRLAEAITCVSDCTGANILTDLGFGYDEIGNLTDTYESTPHSGGYYHITATYWPNKRLNTLGGIPGLPTFTFGPDSEGRISTITASAGQNPVTATSFDEGGHVTAVAFGSGDSDAYTVDPNTGRTNQFAASVGASTLTGTIMWNPNDTIGGLQISDPFNAGGNQNCTYSYDDLERLAGVDCGATWAQTFSYDPFGNITKDGSGSYQPIYSTATNRIQSLPGFTPTYNANGSLLNDGVHTYAWDGEGNLSSVDTVTLIYDAMGRMVEQGRGSTYTQIVYSPTGDKLALMNAQALQKAFLNLPGGASAVYGPSGLAYYRHPDWLGSSRLASTPARAMYADISYAPFGETYGALGNLDVSFTHQQQDTIGALYDFPFREYSPAAGRWISCDPAGASVVDPSNPQSWNKYTFTLNNPVNVVDPNGFENKRPCKDLIQLGITDTSTLDGGNKEMAEVEELAAKYGYNLDFPYSKMGKTSSVWDVFRQGQGAVTAATKSSMEAIQYTLAQGGTNVINISGGAQAYASAMGNMPGASGQIESVVYLSPGTGAYELVRGTDSTDRFSAHGFWDGVVNDTASAESGTVVDKGKLSCSKHSAVCELKEFLNNKCKGACMHDPCQSKIFARNVKGPRDNPANGPPPPPPPSGGIIELCDDGPDSCFDFIFLPSAAGNVSPGGWNVGAFHTPFY